MYSSPSTTGLDGTAEMVNKILLWMAVKIRFCCLVFFQETLKKALGIKGVVKKNRTLYMVGQTRVHVDQVEGLGDFMELEVKVAVFATTVQTLFYNKMRP